MLDACVVQVFIIGLLLFSACLGLGLSQMTRPYTLQNPKKVYLHHTHHLMEGSGGVEVNQSTWDVVGIDSGPVRQALPEALATRQELSFKATEHINLYPVNNFMLVSHDPLCEALPIAASGGHVISQGMWAPLDEGHAHMGDRKLFKLSLWPYLGNWVPGPCVIP